MKLTNKEMAAIGLLIVGMYLVKDDPADVNADGVKDNKDRNIIIVLGAIAFFFLA